MELPSNGRDGGSQSSTVASVPLHANSNGSNLEQPLGRSATMSSVSSVGEFLSRADTDRECTFKKKWLEAKKKEEERAKATARIQEEDKERRADEEERQETPKRDPNLVEWEENDPDNPQQMSFRRKVFITTICCVLTINVTFASSAPSTTVQSLSEEFHVGTEASSLITSMFLCGYVAGPIIWAPTSEYMYRWFNLSWSYAQIYRLIGRRPVFIGSILVYTILQLGPALDTVFGGVLVTRFLAGLFAAAPLTNCGGVIADIWDAARRGTATALFSGSVFMGPVLGPIVGGFVTQSHLGWRWVFWLIMIFAGFCWILILLFLPETYSPVLLTKRARRLRKEDPEKNSQRYAAAEHVDYSPRSLLERTILRPFSMLAQEPILVLTTIYLSVIYGLLYALFSVFPIIWQELRGFNDGQGGLMFIGVGIGTSAGAASTIFIQRNYQALVLKWHGSPPPEERLWGAIYAGPCLVIGIFWLGWTGAYPHIPWYVPGLATIPVGMSFTLIFISYMTYIVDTYLLFSASALAATTIFRSAVGAAFPLFTTPMFHALTVQGASSLIGGVGVLLCPIPLVFYKYGPVIRKRSKFAPCADLKLKEQVEEEERKRRENEQISSAHNHSAQQSSTSTAV